MEQQQKTDEELCEQDLAHVFGGARGFVPVPGARLSEFGKKPLHAMSSIAEEAASASRGTKIGKVVAGGVGAVAVGAAAIGIGVKYHH